MSDFDRPRPDVVISVVVLVLLTVAAFTLGGAADHAAAQYDLPWLPNALLTVYLLGVARHFVKLGRLY